MCGITRRGVVVDDLPFQTERFSKARVGRIVTEGAFPVLVEREMGEGMSGRRGGWIS